MIVLDTHALVWWVAGNDQLSSAAAKAIENARAHGSILISAISAWEIAMLVQADRLELVADVDRWLLTVAEIPTVRFIPVDNEIATHSVFLPGQLHRDPADRIIIATARRESTALVTGDGKIQRYPHVRTIW